MKFGVITFPGTWSDMDCTHALRDVLKQDVRSVWHKDTTLEGIDCVIVPGGFSYGDYLRAGAIARFSPIMAEVEKFAARGKLVFGICNGFQILCEAGLLPGALMTNSHLEYRCQWVNLKTENGNSPFTNRCQAGQVVRIPISHHDGNYYADDATVKELEESGRIVFRYCDESGHATVESNPNGSLHNIAGIMNRAGNVMGMMPHPERACELLLGGTDGNLMWNSIINWVQQTH